MKRREPKTPEWSQELPIVGITVWEISRIGRVPRLVLPLLERLAKAKRPVHYRTSGWGSQVRVLDFTRPEDEHAVTNDLNMAFQEAHSIKMRTQRPMRKKWAQGICPYSQFKETPFHFAEARDAGNKVKNGDQRTELVIRRREGAVALAKAIIRHLENAPRWTTLVAVASLLGTKAPALRDALQASILAAVWTARDRSWEVEMPDELRVLSAEEQVELQELLAACEETRVQDKRPSAVQEMAEQHGLPAILASPRIRIVCSRPECDEEMRLAVPSDPTHGFRDRYDCSRGHHAYEPSQFSYMAVQHKMRPHCAGCGRRDAMRFDSKSKQLGIRRAFVWTCDFCGDTTARVVSKLPLTTRTIHHGMPSRPVWQETRASDQKTLPGGAADTPQRSGPPLHRARSRTPTDRSAPSDSADPRPLSTFPDPEPADEGPPP